MYTLTLIEGSANQAFRTNEEHTRDAHGSDGRRVVDPVALNELRNDYVLREFFEFCQTPNGAEIEALAQITGNPLAEVDDWCKSFNVWLCQSLTIISPTESRKYRMDRTTQIFCKRCCIKRGCIWAIQRTNQGTVKDKGQGRGMNNKAQK